MPPANTAAALASRERRRAPLSAVSGVLYARVASVMEADSMSEVRAGAMLVTSSGPTLVAAETAAARIGQPAAAFGDIGVTFDSFGTMPMPPACCRIVSAT